MGKTLLGSLLVLGQAQAGTMTRTSSFEYDAATGLLTKEVIEPDNAQLRLETSYTYDAYGNKVSATTSSAASGAAAVAPRTSGTTYDANGQFPVTSTNALGQSESRTYDARFGKVTSLTGPNGLTTQWQYDSFGRKTREIRADGTQTKWEYLYCSGVNGGTTPCPSYGVYVVVTTPLASDGTTANGPWSKVYFDSLDREIKSETVGFDGSSIVAKDTQYDSLGRVSRTSLPYYANQTQQWSTVTYDALSRVVLTTAPDGSQSQTTYNGLTITVTNALNQTQTKVKNSQGQVVKVIDAQNNSLTYQYDAIGNMVATKDPNGNVVQLSYDLRGRKIGMVDPDMGTWSYEYNGFGELIRQTDAKGQVSTISYDKLGRMTSRSEPDLVSTWTYDNCAKGVGKLCSVSSDNGYQKTNSYDNLGRNVSTSTTIDTGYAEGVSYDANGRIATQTYPTGLVVKYVYTSLGYLKEVRNNQTNALLWRGDTQNAMGQLLQQTYGNNVVTQQVFEATTGRLKNIYAGAGNSVQNFSYQYDSLGNMVSRADGNQNLTETFLYDSLNRLTNAVVNSPQAGLSSTNYSYDALGNITNRSDMGSYVYGAVNSRPHALKELNFIHGGKLQYTYDANGALIAEVAVDSTGAVIADRGRTESYTSYGMLKTVSSPSVALSFVYGPDHQRIKQVAPSATTIYLNPDNTGGLFYEKDIKADGTVEHKHYITAGGSVIALIKQTGTTQTMNYMHRDQLGSTTTITDESGNVIERLAYEPFGKRRQAGGATDSEGTVVGINTDRGFTNHEHLEELGLIHMNGRVYDPALGRFMSADPYIQAPDDIQSYNRYAYVLNRPLTLADPTGYFSFGGFLGGGLLGGFGGSRFANAGKSIAIPTKVNIQNWQKDIFDFQKTLPGQHELDKFVMGNKWAYVAGQAVATFYGGPYGAAAWSSYYTYQATGSIDAAFKSGAIAYVNSEISDGVKNIYGSSYPVHRIFVNALASGTQSVISGGKFTDGARFGFASSVLAYLNVKMRAEMIEQSKIMPENDGTGLSAGLFGDRFKLAGGRWNPELIGQIQCSLLGCMQNGPGKVFGISYSSGGMIDLVTESFAGPHDFANAPWFYDSATGMIRAGSSGFMKDLATNYTTSLAFAAPFAAAALSEELNVSGYRQGLRRK
ncbi:RHS repeat domain-containing protein [Herbaspirillum huttiense]|uniref:RHS repeat domain-containing protein n=1 Tax=Herbaspirillum huttiense TaxID=863372 RepID=UPI002176A5C0|nr:RHS repeat-associated core domain-containing protein [Herbaspirillum huttiense]UWE14533.1 type IV secretion protein Rhs [Herbaspirillum huttiense]